jgi:hypothetical protein
MERGTVDSRDLVAFYYLQVQLEMKYLGLRGLRQPTNRDVYPDPKSIARINGDKGFGDSLSNFLYQSARMGIRQFKPCPFAQVPGDVHVLAPSA